MNRLRRLRRLHLLVLLCQLLVLATATAAPWVNPQPYAPWVSMCGGGGNDADPLACPACLPVQAPPPAAVVPFIATNARHHSPTAFSSSLLDLQRLPVPPARGPPTV